MTAQALRKIQTLFFVVSFPFLIRLVWVLLLPEDYYWSSPGDEALYAAVGLQYLRGLFAGDLSVFLVNSEHPPLAKEVAGLLWTGFPSVEPWRVVRFEGAVFQSLVAAFVYLFARRLFSAKIAVLSWALYTFDPNSFVTIGFSLDIVYTFFGLASLYLLYRRTPKHADLILAGVLMGLAFASKYTAIVLFPAAALMLRHRTLGPGASPGRTVLAFFGFAAAIAVVLNPIFWSSSLFGGMLGRQTQLLHLLPHGWALIPAFTVQGIGLGEAFTFLLVSIMTLAENAMLVSPYLSAAIIALTIQLILRRSIPENTHFTLGLLMVTYGAFYFLPKFLYYYSYALAPFTALWLASLFLNDHSRTRFPRWVSFPLALSIGAPIIVAFDYWSLFFGDSTPLLRLLTQSWQAILPVMLSWLVAGLVFVGFLWVWYSGWPVRIALSDSARPRSRWISGGASLSSPPEFSGRMDPIAVKRYYIHEERYDWVEATRAV